jgi:putative Holliday junction resolvase
MRARNTPSVADAMQATPGSVLAFDYGTRFIGVAVGNRMTASARALKTLGNGDRGLPWPPLDALVADWQPERFVVGLPLALDGGDQPMTVAARGFGAALEQRYRRPVHLVDERHTSGAAASRFAEQRARGNAKRKDAAAIDALAAQIILESWLADGADSAA